MVVRCFVHSQRFLDLCLALPGNMAILIIMLMLLCTLIVIYRRLDIGGCCANCNEKVFIFLPFSLYLGWISVATVANATAFLVSLGWGRWGFSEVFWVVMVLAFLTALTITVLFTRKDFAFAMAILWALTGIVIKRSAAPGGQERLTVYAATAGIVLIALAVLVQFFRKRNTAERQFLSSNPLPCNRQPGRRTGSFCVPVPGSYKCRSWK